MTVQLFVAPVVVAALIVHVAVAPVGKLPASPVAFENVTVPCGGSGVPAAPTSVTVAVQVMFVLTCCAIGEHEIVVVVGRLFTAMVVLPLPVRKVASPP